MCIQKFWFQKRNSHGNHAPVFQKRRRCASVAWILGIFLFFVRKVNEKIVAGGFPEETKQHVLVIFPKW